MRADGGRTRACNPMRGQEADAHRVDETVVAIGVVEHRLAADRGDSDAVSVMPDARDGAAEVVVRLREPQAVEDRDRPGSHGDDVAQDPAHTRRRPLERLDRGWMVVGLDLERHRLAFAEIDDAGILTGALQYAFSLGGKPFQEESRVLVAAVLRPEEREDRQLELVGVSPEQSADPVELPVGQPQSAVEWLFRSDLRQVFESTRGRRRVPATFPPQ